VCISSAGWRLAGWRLFSVVLTLIAHGVTLSGVQYWLIQMAHSGVISDLSWKCCYGSLSAVFVILEEIWADCVLCLWAVLVSVRLLEMGVMANEVLKDQLTWLSFVLFIAPSLRTCLHTSTYTFPATTTTPPPLPTCLGGGMGWCLVVSSVHIMNLSVAGAAQKKEKG